MHDDEQMELRASVYLTGYPDDLDPHSNMIEAFTASDIADCIRYEEEGSVPQEELENILKEMHLILLFVSSRFLYLPNTAKDIILPFADRNGIPVIAISLEKYIEYDFRKQYGMTLFFDPYKEEVSSRMNDQITVMIKMLLMVGMQKNFMDASAIPDVLQKLIEMNRSGMIFRNTYMMAMIWQARQTERAKKIFLQSGGQAHLEQWVHECCVLGDFLRELGRAGEALEIYSAMRSVLDKRDDPQPKLQYILLAKIGYAYEEMHQNSKACQSFSDALRIAGSIVKEAEPSDENAAILADFQRLCKKLGDLYSDMNQDPAAVQFYQNYLDFQNMLCSISVSGYGRQELADVYECIAVCLYSSADYAQAKEYYLKSLPIRRELYNEHPDQPRMQDLVLCLRRLGEMYMEFRDTDSARKYYLEALHIDHQLSEISMSYQTTLNRIILYFKMGDLCFVLEKLDEAESYYYKCFVLSTDFYTNSNAAEAQEQLLDANIQLAEISRAKGAWENALSYAENAVNTGNSLLKRRNDVHIRSRVATAYSIIGSIHYHSKKYKQAADHHRESLKIYGKIANETGSVDASKNAALEFGYLGDILLAAGIYDEAEECYLEQYQHMENLRKNDNSYELQRDLATASLDLGVLYRIQKEYEKADEYLQKAVKMRQAVAENAPCFEAKYALASSYHECAFLYCKNGQLRKSKNYYDKTLALNRELAAVNPSAAHTGNLAKVLMNLADLREMQHQFREILTYYSEAVQICEQLAKEFPSHSSDDLLSRALEGLGSYYAKYDPRPEPDVYYEDYLIRAIKIRENIANDTQAVSDWEQLAMIYYNSSVVMQSAKWAQIFLPEALDTWHYLAERTKEEKYLELCETARKAIAYFHLEEDGTS